MSEEFDGIIIGTGQAGPPLAAAAGCRRQGRRSR